MPAVNKSVSCRIDTLSLYCDSTTRPDEFGRSPAAVELFRRDSPPSEISVLTFSATNLSIALSPLHSGECRLCLFFFTIANGHISLRRRRPHNSHDGVLSNSFLCTVLFFFVLRRGVRRCDRSLRAPSQHCCASRCDRLGQRARTTILCTYVIIHTCCTTNRA